MSIVVEQTLPYTNSTLQLDSEERWSQLLPLIRPSVTEVKLASGHSALLDSTLTKSGNVLIAAIGTVGNFSSTILSQFQLSLFSAEGSARESITAENIAKTLKENQCPMDHGLVIVRRSVKQDLVKLPGKIVEILVCGELEFDHVLSLLFSSRSEIKESFGKTTELLENFINSVKITSTFNELKSGECPTLAHETGIANFKSAKEALDKDLSLLLSKRQSKKDEIYSIHFSDINGLSRLEINLLAHEIAGYTASKGLSSYLTHSTISDIEIQARGWAISLCSISREFLATLERPQISLTQTPATVSSFKTKQGTSKIKIPEDQLRKTIRAGCESVIKEEPTITDYDTIVGDGDCGYTLRDGAKQVMSFIENTDLSELAPTLSDLVDDLEVNMGGTSGALYCIFLSSLAQNLWDASTLPDALKVSLDHLLKYTKARLGDRTCLDCLIPFVETLRETGDAKKALAEAAEGVESTKKLEAKVGRSSYLDEAATRGVPDPGAYGLLKLLEGMVNCQ